MQRFVAGGDGARLWVEVSGDPNGSPVLLIMGANASGLAWPPAMIEALGLGHQVIRYDHRDTGKSTWAFDEHPYAIVDLASDAIRILDDLGIARAHVVGMSLGATLVQLMLLDHPQRLLSATVFAAAVLEGADDSVTFAGTDPRLLELWSHLMDPRDEDAEIAFRVAHWELLNGGVIAFDAEQFRALERRVIAHAGRHDNPAAHARADARGIDRGAELAAVTVPVLVIEAPVDPINPPPAASRIAAAIPGAQLVTIAGMGHALPDAVVAPVVEVIERFIASAT